MFYVRNQIITRDSGRIQYNNYVRNKIIARDPGRIQCHMSGTKLSHMTLVEFNAICQESNYNT